MLDSVILAAGEGTRMNSKKSKVLHEICGVSVIECVVESAQAITDGNIIAVVGHSGEQVRAHLGDRVKYAEQKERLGTGHAVAQALDLLTSDTTLVLAGDTPLITKETLIAGCETHKNSGASITVLTAVFKKPTGYGRIICDGENITRIVEEKDATDQERKITEVNSGMYFFDTNFLKSLPGKLNTSNVQGEFYLTDSIEVAVSEGLKVSKHIIKNDKEIFGINDRDQLEKAARLMRKIIITQHQINGVTFMDSKSTYIERNVKIGRDTIIYPQTILQGNTAIGEDCVLMSSRISDCTIGNGTKIDNSVVLGSKIGNNTTIGPFAYIRPNCIIGDRNRIGDFVEVKNSNLGNDTKVSHLSYIGDADIGNNVNFGCGSVVVNYDGKKKHRSEIQDGAFIGCNVNLVSPVVVEKNAFVAAGSTITKTVPARSLAIARNKQENRENWVKED
jgi:bifunctional UDP-N-acetylglucosamine pyrophosphorylase/glucosamine-1-phosphate N-acetyltransferase